MLGRLLPRTRSAFESRTEVWREVGLGSEIDSASARRGRDGAVIALLLIAAVLVAFSERKTLFPGYGQEVRIATVVLLILLGWALARSLGRGFAPTLYRRLEPGTAGTIGFLEELDRDEVVVRIVTTPMNPPDGATLAEQVLTGLRHTDGAHGEASEDSNGHGPSDANGGGGPA
jgi:hypothetical protein